MGLYDEVEIEDMEWSDDLQGFTYSCPCGDLFQITLVSCTGRRPRTVMSRECMDHRGAVCMGNIAAGHCFCLS